MHKKMILHKNVVVPNVSPQILESAQGRLLIGVVPKWTAEIKQIPNDIKTMPSNSCPTLPSAGGKLHLLIISHKTKKGSSIYELPSDNLNVRRSNYSAFFSSSAAASATGAVFSTNSM